MSILRGKPRKVFVDFPDTGGRATLTTTDRLGTRLFFRCYNSAIIRQLRRAVLDYLFPVRITTSLNHMPESGYTCKVRDGFIDVSMWRLGYPDGKAEFHSAAIPCAPLPEARQGAQVRMRDRSRLIATTPEVQATFDAWIKAHARLQSSQVTESNDPLKEYNAGVKFGIATSRREGRWRVLRKQWLERLANNEAEA